MKEADVKMIKMSDVQTQTIEWLWYPLFLMEN